MVSHRLSLILTFRHKADASWGRTLYYTASYGAVSIPVGLPVSDQPSKGKVKSSKGSSSKSGMKKSKSDCTLLKGKGKGRRRLLRSMPNEMLPSRNNNEVSR